MFDSRFFWLTILVLFVGLLYLLSPILTPFLLAALFAYLCDPLVDKLETRKLSRTLSVCVVFLGFILSFLFIFLFLVPTVSAQFAQLGAKLPDYALWIQENIGPSFNQLFTGEEGAGESIQQFLRDNIGQASNIARSFIESLSSSISKLITFATYLFLVPVVTFYLLRDWNILIDKINELIPIKYQDTIHDLLNRSHHVLGGFLRGQLLVMLALGIIYSIGLSFLGLEMAVVIGMLSGLVSFVPYLGLIVGIILSGIMALLQFQDWTHVLGVGVVFVVAQFIEGTFLTPKLVGDRTGLHPIAVLFSVLAGGQLFGFMGILLALPFTAVVNVFLGHFKTSYLNSDVYKDETDYFKLPKTQYINHEKINNIH